MITNNKLNYTVDIIETLDEFKEIRKDWERLFTLKNEIPIFFSFEVFQLYYETIIKNFHSIKINIFVIKNKNQQTVAIFPLTFETKIFPPFLPLKKLAVKDQFLLGFYYFLIDPSENPEIIFQRFLQHLKKIKRRWDLIKISSIPEDEKLFKVFTSILKKYYKIDKNISNTLVIDCKRDFDEYINNDIDGKDLRELKRKCRRMETKGNVNIIEIKDQQEIEKKITNFYNIEDSGWKGKEGTSLKRSYYGQYYRILSSIISKNNKLRLYFLQVNNENIAGIYAIIDHEILYLIKIGYSNEFRQYSPSNVLFYLLFEQLFKEKKIQKIDFYGPYYYYQKIFGKKTRKKYDIVIYNSKIVPNLYNISFKALKALKNLFPENSLKKKLFKKLTKHFYI